MKIRKIKIPVIDVRWFLLTLLLFSYLAFCLFPPLMIIKSGEIVKVMLLAGICGLVIMCYRRMGEMNIVCLLYCAYLPIISYISGKVTIGNRYINLLFLPIGCIVFDIYERYGKINLLRRMLALFVPALLFTYFQTWRALGQNTYAVRKIKTSGQYTEMMRKSWVGGYEYIYLLVIIAILAWGCCLLKPHMKHKLFSFLIFVFCTALIVRSNYLTATATVVIAAGTAFILFLYWKHIFWKGALMIILGVGITIGNELIRIIANFFADTIITSGKTHDRLISMGNAGLISLLEIIQGEGRAELYLNSLDKLSDNFLLGVVFTETGSISDISQHSFIIDTFTLFGVAIGVITCVILLHSFKKRYFKKPLGVITIPVLIGTGIIVGGNNLTASVAFAITIIYPCIMADIERERINERK